MSNGRFRQWLLLVVMLLAPALSGCKGQIAELPIDVNRLSEYQAAYQADDPAGGELELRLVQSDGGLWTVHSALTAPSGEMLSEVNLRDDLMPQDSRVELRINGEEYVIAATYGNNRLLLQAETPTGPQSAERNLRPPYYDNEQLLAILPALRLEPGEPVKFVLIATQSATKLTPSLQLMAGEGGQPLVEQVPLAGGNVECQMITFDAGVSGATEQTFWVTTEAPYRLAKMDNGTITYTLVER
ncbi:MAG: hypothetical protein ACOX2K_05485 [Bacillota bacterium]